MFERLVAHPQSEHPLAKWITADIERDVDGMLRLHFKLAGEIANMRVPGHAQAQRADQLWRTTCFEVFIREGLGEGYLEFNLSPSTLWAAYAFATYRESRVDLWLSQPPHIRFVASGQGMALIAVISGLPTAAEWQIGLSAVLEDWDGNFAFWALAHPPGAPDFHHPDCFALELPAPRPA